MVKKIFFSAVAIVLLFGTTFAVLLYGLEAAINLAIALTQLP